MKAAQTIYIKLTQCSETAEAVARKDAGFRIPSLLEFPSNICRGFNPFPTPVNSSIYLLLFSLLLLSCSSVPTSERTSSWVETTLASMTLEEKVGQLIMPKIYSHYYSSESEQFQHVVHMVRDLKVGGVVLFQGDVYEQAVLLNKLQKLSTYPLLIAADYERGTAMRTRRGTYFPDAMAIGATRSRKYAYEIGKAIADEARAIGVHQNYAPVADVNNNPENPVINTRSFSDDRELVAELAEAFTRGMNDGNLVSTAKHFPGHGDTDVDSHLHLPTLPYTRQRLDSLELYPFKRVIDVGVKSVMVGHLSVPSIDATNDLPATLSSSLMTDLLRKQLAFKGLVVTDAMDMMGVARGFSNADASVRAIQSGADVLLLPENEDGAVNALIAAVKSGEIPEARLNESVRRVLAVKQWLGLERNRIVAIDKISEHVAIPAHLQLAKAVARDAITVLRNDGNILPLRVDGRKKTLSVLISDREDNWTEVNRASNPWPVEPAGDYFARLLREHLPLVESIRLSPATNAADVELAVKRIQSADVILLPLYVKVRTHTGRIGIPTNLRPVVEKIDALRKPTVVIAFGNPYNVASFPRASALVCAYTDAEPLVEASVEALFGAIPWRGKLPIEIRGLYSFGSGLEAPQTTLRRDYPTVAGFDAAKLHRIDSILTSAMRDSAFPAAEVLVARNGVVAYNKVFGTFTYDKSSRSINSETLFDLASLTKVIATTTAVMKLYDEKKILLDDKVGRFVPQFAEGKKSEITIRNLLLHNSGLPPFRQLWKICPDASVAIDSVYATQLVANPGDTTIYSDLGFITLGKIVEMVSGMTLDEFVKKNFFEPLAMPRTMFKPPKELWNNVAPTEYDSSWRKTLVQGTVHDENAEFLGGVSGHAGLFSTTSDLAVLMQMLMNGGVYGGVRYLSEATVKEFTRRQNNSSTRALGWDTKSPKGSTAGNYFSSNSFGHTGFTGTSIWADPERNLFVILLTNRVHPTRANMKIAKVRPAVADAVIEALNHN